MRYRSPGWLSCSTTDPQFACHETAVLLVLLTVAVKLCVPLVSRLTGFGATEMATGRTTLTFAWADLVPSAALVAVTVQVVAPAGAV